MADHKIKKASKNASKKRMPKKWAARVPEDDLALMRLGSILEVYPVSKSEWWNGVREGRYPKPVRLGKRISAWRVGEIRELLLMAAGDVA
jgi:predicted DNA-binding transcriptional regulator AlpA